VMAVALAVGSEAISFFFGTHATHTRYAIRAPRTNTYFLFTLIFEIIKRVYVYVYVVYERGVVSALCCVILVIISYRLCYRCRCLSLAVF
jgi:hypothetical protein